MISGPYSRSVKKVRESDVEAYLKRQCTAHGWTSEKFKSPNKANVPDQIVSIGDSEVFFVECKAPGRKPTPGQLRDHERRRAAGYRVYVADSKDIVDSIMNTEGMIR